MNVILNEKRQGLVVHREALVDCDAASACGCAWFLTQA